MKRIRIDLANAAATEALGAALAPLLKAGDAICLSGDLGAGKSTLARGLIAARTGAREAPSPTFAFVETYEAADLSLWHFDLYRLEAPGDVWELGYEDALEDGAALIEWPERIGALAPENALSLRLEIEGERRIAVIKADESWAMRLAAAGIDDKRIA